MTEGGRAEESGLAQRRGSLGAIASITLVVVAVALAVLGGDEEGPVDLPSPREIAAWLQFVEIQCPEGESGVH